MFLPVYYYPRPRSIPARLALLALPAMPPVGGFGTGAFPVEPGYFYFASGNPIGGSIGTSFRGVRAGRFPIPIEYTGPGAPIDSEATGIAGAPIGFE